MTRPSVIVYAPQLYELGFKQHHIDGEALALHASLTSDGYDCVLVDAYYRGARQPSLSQAITQAGRPEAVIAHLWTSDAYGPRLRAIAAELAEARRTFGIPVIGFGPLAVSAGPSFSPMARSTAPPGWAGTTRTWQPAQGQLGWGRPSAGTCAATPR